MFHTKGHVKARGKANVLSRHVENIKFKLLEIRTTVSGKKTTGIALIVYQEFRGARETGRPEDIEIEMAKLRRSTVTKKEEKEEKPGEARGGKEDFQSYQGG